MFRKQQKGCEIPIVLLYLLKLLLAEGTGIISLRFKTFITQIINFWMTYIKGVETVRYSRINIDSQQYFYEPQY